MKLEQVRLSKEAAKGLGPLGRVRKRTAIATHANLMQALLFQIDAGGADFRAANLGAALMVSARLINAKDYGIKVGSEAEVTVIDAKSPAEAVAINAPVLAVFKRGRQTVSRPRAELMRP